MAQYLQIEYRNPNRRDNLLAENFALDLSCMNAIGSAVAQYLCTKCRDYARRTYSPSTSHRT